MAFLDVQNRRILLYWYVACFFQAWIGSFRGNDDGVVWGLSAPGALPEPLVGEFGVISSVYKAVFVKIGL